MNFFRDTVRIPVDAACKNQMKNMTFDGCAYYFTTCDNNIIKTDLHFGVTKCFKTSRTYDCLCWDDTNHCFWAVASKVNDKIYQCNRQFEETGTMELQWSNTPYGTISGISYNCCRDSLLFTIGGEVFESDESGRVARVFGISQCEINSILSICPGFILSGIKNNQQFVYIINDGEILFYEPFNRRNVIRNIVYSPCCDAGNRFELLVMGNNCNPYIIRTNAGDLGFTLCHCNQKKCKSHCCKNPCCSRDKCAEILESIALEEAALAHILNAEGEKLQKVLAVSDDIDEILCVNREIRKTIIDVTHLEHVLYEKLTAVLEVCDHKFHCGMELCSCGETTICEWTEDEDEDCSQLEN